MQTFPRLRIERSRLVYFAQPEMQQELSADVWLLPYPAGPTACGFGLDRQQMLSRLRTELGEDLSDELRARSFEPGDHPWWDREWRRPYSGGRLFWLGCAPRELKDTALHGNPLSAESWAPRWALSLAQHLLRSHGPGGFRQFRPPLALEVSDEFSRSEKRALRALTVLAYGGKVLGAGRVLGALEGMTRWALPVLVPVFVFGGLGKLLAVTPDASIFMRWIQVFWLPALVLSVLGALAVHVALRLRLPLALLPVYSLVLPGMLLGSLALAPQTLNLLTTAEQPVVFAGVINQPCKGRPSPRPCSVEASVMKRNRPLSIEVGGLWGHDVKPGTLVFWCYRRGLLGYPFRFHWDDAWPAACDRVHEEWLKLSPEAVREHLRIAHPPPASAAP